MKKYYKYKKMFFAIVFGAAIVLLFSGCVRDNLISAPTPVVPTVKETAQATGVNPPVQTPNAEEEIHFKDIRLENIVRDTIGKNIGPIMMSDVDEITKFSARVEGILNIDGLQYFKSLEELDLYGNRISDITPIANITSLKKLNLGKNYNILTAGSSKANGLDISSLKGLILLEELDLSDNMITNLEGIGALPALKKLVLKGNRISNISALSGCMSLTYVDLSYNYGLNSDNSEQGVVDLSPLYSISTIETLIAGYNLIENVSGIEVMENLSYIDLSGNFISEVSHINKLKKLETVILHYNALVSIEGFRNNSTIKNLDVSQNLITHFDVILTMSALETLNWSQNNIQDYRPIEKFEEMKE